MTDLNPADLYIVGGPSVGEGMLKWCRCTECGGTGKVPSVTGEPFPCRICKDTDGWDPGRVRHWCIEHDLPHRYSNVLGAYCWAAPDNRPCERWGWVPRIGVLT